MFSKMKRLKLTFQVLSPTSVRLINHVSNKHKTVFYSNFVQISLTFTGAKTGALSYKKNSFRIFKVELFWKRKFRQTRLLDGNVKVVICSTDIKSNSHFLL